MYKNLSGDGLGVSCRQNELIELALTYGFKGIEVDIAEMQSRADRFSPEFARRFVDRTKNSWSMVVGTFKLPVKFSASEADFAKAIERVKKFAVMAESLEAFRCYVDIEAANATLPYHENFEMHRTRIGQVADILHEQGVRLGLGINANPAVRSGKEFQFIYQAEPLLTLIKTIGHPGVGLALDTWNWVVGGGALDQIQELSGNDVVCVRLADVPADVDIANAKDTDRMLPGQSESSIAAGVIKHLAGSGYDGPVAVHPHSSQFSGVTRDNIVQQASSSLTRVFEEAGVPFGVAKATTEIHLENPGEESNEEEHEAAASSR